MFDEMISWGELITLVGFLLGTGVAIVLILALVQLIRVLKNVNEILTKNKENIAKSVAKLPEITENAAHVTTVLKKNMDGIDKVVEDVGKISGTVKKGVETIQNDIVLKAKSILEIVEMIKSLFQKKKEAPPKKKQGTVYRYKYKLGEDKPDEVEVTTGEKADTAPYPNYKKMDSPEEGT